MHNVLIVLPLVLFVQHTNASGSDIVNCAGCFAQKWNWASWQCDVHCDVKISKYGKCIYVLVCQWQGGGAQLPWACPPLDILTPDMPITLLEKRPHNRTDKLPDACKIITFPQLLLRVVNV